MKHKIIILIFILLFSTCYAWSGEQPGNTSAQFLKINPSPRAVSLGNSYSSMSEDADSLYYNPSSIAFIKNINVSLSYIRWFQSMNYMSLFGVLPLDKRIGTFGIGVFGLYSGDIVGTTDDGFGNITETGKNLSAGDYCFLGSYARNILDYFSIGINLKGIYQKLENTGSFAFATDLGALFVFDKYKLKTGLAVQNIGSKPKFVKDAFALPLNVRLGVNYDFIINKKNKVLFIAEGQKTIYEYPTAGLGVEYAFNNMIFVRAGYEYQSKSDSFGLKAGGGFQIKNIKVNYGFDLFNTFGATHFIQINVPFEVGEKIIIEEAEKIIKPEEQKFLDAADDYILNNEYEKALPEYMKIIQSNPDHIRTTYNIACIHSVLNNTGDAIQWIERILKLDSSPEMMERIDKDIDFDNIRDTEDYINLMKKYSSAGEQPIESKEEIEAKEVPETPKTEEALETLETGKVPETPKIPEDAGSLETPGPPESTEAPESPETTESPKPEESPETTESPEPEESPETTDAPALPDIPEAGGSSDFPAAPDISE